MSTADLTLFHAPFTRSSGVRVLLEELSAPHELQVISLKAGEQRLPSYLGVNPMGKVPALRHGDVLITEQVAIYLYLADLFPRAGLAPGLDDPRRGPYLRWLVYYAACFEPAIVDKSLKREPAPRAMCPYGDYDTMQNTLVALLEEGTYILGDSFSAADVLWGSALTWMTKFKLVPDLPVIMTYVERINARPAFSKIRESDAALAAAQTPQ